jgi:uncharacterized protein with gpF-like domain
VIADLMARQRADLTRRVREEFADVRTPHLLHEKRASDEAVALADLVFTPTEWHDEWRRELTRPVLVAAVEGAMSELAEFEQRRQVDPEDFRIELGDLPDNVRNAVAAEVDTIMSRPYWHEIHQTTRQEIANAIQAGLAEGESLHQIMYRIEDTGIGPLGSETITRRGTRIARTETTGAMNAGHQAAQDGLASDGLVQGKQWLSIIDRDTRGTHITAHDQVVAVTANFTVGDSEAPYPGHHSLPAEERVNCRCTTVSVHSPGARSASPPSPQCPVHGNRG